MTRLTKPFGMLQVSLLAVAFGALVLAAPAAHAQSDGDTKTPAAGTGGDSDTSTTGPRRITVGTRSGNSSFKSIGDASKRPASFKRVVKPSGAKTTVREVDTKTYRSDPRWKKAKKK